MSGIWMKPEPARAVMSAPSGETLLIRTIDPEFWSEDGPIEYHKYVGQHEAYLEELLAKDEIVYHYTTLDGLRGIVQQGALWASDVRQLNDRFEIKYPLSQMHHLLAAEGKIGQQPLDAVFRPAGTWQFATCFSHARDQLSQWRAYGARTGISIGFHKEHIRKVAEKVGGELVNCRYLGPGDFGAVRKELNPIASALVDPKNLNAQGAFVNMSVQDELTKQAVKIARSIKHASFAEERETRLSVSIMKASEAKFRSTAQSLIPYVEIDLDGRRIGVDKRLPYTNHLGMLEILVWPNNADDQLLDAIYMLLGDAGGVRLSKSASPYRT